MCSGLLPRGSFRTVGVSLLRFVAMWVVVNTRVPFWVLIIIRHLIFRAPNKEP